MHQIVQLRRHQWWSIKANRETVTWAHQHHCPPVYITYFTNTVFMSHQCISSGICDQRLPWHDRHQAERFFGTICNRYISGMSAPGEGVANVNSSDTMNNGHQNAKTTWWWHQNMVLTQHKCLAVTKSGDIDGQLEWVPANAAAAKCPENPTEVGTNPIVGTGLCGSSWDQSNGWDGFIW